MKRRRQRAKRVRPMHLVSFENDLDRCGWRWLTTGISFTCAMGARRACCEAAAGNRGSLPGLSWELAPGDFLDSLRGEEPRAFPAPELIFYDPFSGNSDGRLWTPEAFRLVRAACRERAAEF